MANLLTLALTETTQTEYEVVAWDLDNKKWVLLPRLPLNTATVDNTPVWDLFQVTRAEIMRANGEQRSNVHVISPRTQPVPVTTIPREDRLDWLNYLSHRNSVDTPKGTNSFVTLVEPDNITEIYMQRKEPDNRFDETKPFFWENRIEFFHNNILWETSRVKVGVPCKDLRWKTYWHEVAFNRDNYFWTAREKWLNTLRQNRTFFVIEYYNQHKTYVIAGIHSIRV
ncbi:hypothetical protein B5M42_012945 [Paenibacillus athensensis]|uniref:hypothetical protein n=1 Tax=Paenibacillus athensensis TaxID=1967502 RepID=UPI00106F2A04|nr:hypothetical protein [Paenibacillus athensensis]MCD1259741.1 hypothetical protein [Paenibacillus athensensis]